MSAKKPSFCVVGLTGQTGAGKSTVARLLREGGVTVIDCDAVARTVVQPGSACLAELTAAFSPEILREDGSLDRQRLAALAFADAEGTARLNAVTHPHILRALKAELAALAQAGETLAVLDAPTLFESGAHRLCRAVVAVVAKRDIRLARIRQRDGLSPEQAEARMRAQQPDEFYTRHAGYILRNNDAPASLAPRVGKLIRWMRAL